MLAEIAAERAHLDRDRGARSGRAVVPVRFERDLEIHNLSRDIFDTEVVRIWERRSTALDGVGDPLFALFARDFAPLAERLDAIASRLEATPAFLDASRSRAVQPQVRLWQTIEIETAGEIPSLFDEVVAAGEDALGAARAAPAEAGRRRGKGRRRPTTGPGSRARWPTAPTTGRSVASATTSSSACARSTGSTPTTILEIGERAARAEPGGPRRSGPGDRPDASTSRPSSTGSRATTRRPSRPRSTPTATSWSGPGSTSSSATS